MKIYIDNGLFKDGILKTYDIKVKSLIGKRTICHVIADDVSFSNLICSGINNIIAEYNYIECVNKDHLYKYIKCSDYDGYLSIKFTKYMSYIIWKNRNTTITKLKRFIKSPIVAIKNIILLYKVKNKVQDFEEFYNK